MRFTRYVILVCTISFLFAFPMLSYAQEVVINSVDTTAFPDVIISYRATNADGQNITNTPPIVSENGQPIFNAEFLPRVDRGVEFTIVIDANGSIAVTDEDGGATRIANTRTAIANLMRRRRSTNRDGGDAITLIVPGGADGIRLLTDRETDPLVVVDEIGKYNPTALPFQVNVQGMLMEAFRRSAATSSQSRYQVVILFSNAEYLEQQLDYTELLRGAAESEVEFYGAILGRRADEIDITNLATIYDVTGGGYVHMIDARDFNEVATEIAEKRTQGQVNYQSTATESGAVNVELLVEEAKASVAYDIELSQPSVELLIEQTTIIRQGDEGVPFDQLEPRTIPVQAQVRWPFDRKRPLNSVLFTVNGEMQSLPSGAVLDADGIVMVDWDVSQLQAGNYALQLEVVDDMGQSGVSDEIRVPIALDVAGSNVPVEPTVQPDATAAPNPIAVVQDTVAPYLDFFNRGNLMIALLGLIPLLLIFLLWRRSTRLSASPTLGGARDLTGVDAQTSAKRTQRRQRRDQVERVAQLQQGQASIQGSQQGSQTVLDRPMAAALPLEPIDLNEQRRTFIEDELPTQACLERFSPETGAVLYRLPLTKLVHIIGSDALSSDLIVDDLTVSRLHASIRWEHNRFTLYDEGSAYGTHLNMNQLGLSPRFLKNGDEISFGDAYVRFKIGRCEDDYQTTNIQTRRDNQGGPVDVKIDQTACEAAVLDLDGTLIDSENASFVAWRGVGIRLGRTFIKEDLSLVQGVRLDEAIDNVIAYWQLSHSADDLRQMLEREWRLAQGSIGTMPGARELLQELNWREIPTGIATSSHRHYTEEKLRRFNFSVNAIVSGDEVRHSKPAPDIYLLCAERLGVAPNRCLAIEDSVQGHFAAAKAGMRVVVVPGPFNRPEEYPDADYIFADLHELRRNLDIVLDRF